MSAWTEWACNEDGLPYTLSHIETAHIAAVLRFVEGNKSAAARILGINRRTLYRKMNEAKALRLSPTTFENP